MKNLLANRPQLVSGGILVLWIGLLFGTTVQHGFYYDDAHSIVENERLHNWREIPTFFVDPGAFSATPDARMYRPLLLTTFALNLVIGGPAGLHLFNILCHAVAALLLWRLARHLLNPSHAWLLALLFAAHPMVTEPVNYISSRSSSLSTIFVLAAMLVLVRSTDPGRGKWLALWTLAGVLTKATGVVILPLAGAYLFLTHRRDQWRLLVGPAIVAVLYVVGIRAILGKALGEPVRGPLAQMATQLKALPYYARSFLVPVNQSIDPQFRMSPTTGEWVVLAAAVFLCGLLFLLWQARHRPVVCLGMVWILLTLAPTLIMPLNVLVNEHRLYMALPGLLLAVGALLPEWGQQQGRIIAVVALVLLGVLVVQRNHDWRSEPAIWEAAIASGPQMTRPYVNLGRLHIAAANYQEAIPLTQKALDLDPQLTQAHYNIGTAYMHTDRHEEAITHFERALAIDPEMDLALVNLGNSYKALGRTADAIASYKNALSISNTSGGRHNLAALYLASAQYDSAAVHFRQALQTDPRQAHNLANAYFGATEYDSAVVYFRQAVETEPDRRDSRVGLAKALQESGRHSDAKTILTSALDRWPDEEQFLELMAHAEARLGQYGSALSIYQKTALPDADIRTRLGQTAQSDGNWDEAARQYEAGIEAKPSSGNLHNRLGEVRLIQGRKDDALLLFGEASRLDPSLSAPLRNIGLIHLQHRRFDEAIAALERARALEAGVGDAGIWELLARAHTGRADLPAAIAAYEEAIARAPQRAALYHSLGLLLLNEGEWSEAATQIEMAISRRPGWADAYINLASAYLRLDRGDDAASAYERFLELHLEDDEYRQRAERQLRHLRGS
ncbi:MAG: tetratricopeptide repeat protein [Gemmatimonadetes bacterium]|nr:tetratricopeptide repeat protein [Gemmatimonadota bacterium]